MMESAVSDAGRALFNDYLLELLADSEKQKLAVESHVLELISRATAAELRLSDVEEEVGRLNEALAAKLPIQQKPLSQ